MSLLTPVRHPRIEVAFSAGAFSVTHFPRIWGVSRRLSVVQTKSLSFESFNPTPHELNFKDEDAVIQELKATFPVAWPTAIALSLPVESVHLSVMELTTVPDSASEMRTFLRWRMQQQVGYSLAEAHVLYRVYYAAGSSPTVLAACVQPIVMQQYIHVCRAAGLLPVSMGSSLLHLFDWFKTDMAGSSNSFFAVCTERHMVVVAIRAGQPIYLRSKPIRSDAMVIDQLTTTLQFCFGLYPDSKRPSEGHEPVLYFVDSTKTLSTQLSHDGSGYFSVRAHPTDSWTVRLMPLDMQARGAGKGSDVGVTTLASVAPRLSVLTRVMARLPWSISKNGTGKRAVRCSFREGNLGFELTDVARASLVQWSMVGAMLVGVCLAGWWWWNSMSINDAAEKYERATIRTHEMNQFAELQMKQDGLVLPADELKRVEHDGAMVTQLIEKRAFLWTRLLTDLEFALPEHVTLLTVTPQFKNGSVGLHGAAKTLHDLHAFVSELQKHPAFHRVTLSNHSYKATSTSREADHPGQGESPGSIVNSHIEFSLTAEYQPTL